jgi:hypothetical protein
MDFRSLNMKKRIRRCGPQRQSYWEEAVRRRERGGLSARESCRVEGLRKAAFYWWRRELARRRQSSGAAIPSPKLVCIALPPYATSQAPRPGRHPNARDFSDAAFSVIPAFLSGDSGRFAAELESAEP